MNRTYLAAMCVIAVAIAAAAGVAYAYQSSLTVGDNTVSADAHSIDVCYSNNHSAISEPFGVPSFESGATKTITGYCITTTGPGTLIVKCDMIPQSWVFGDSMTISIGGNTYAFGKTGVNPNMQVDVPAQFSGAGVSGSYYDFTITINYSDKTVDSAEDAYWSSFPETKFLFTFAAS